MLREQIRNDIAKTIDNLPHFARSTSLRASRGEYLTIDKTKIEVARTSEAKFGDYTTNAALRIASSYSSNPSHPAILSSSNPLTVNSAKNLNSVQGKLREKSNKDSSRDARSTE